jgi:hypothetical protein
VEQSVSSRYNFNATEGAVLMNDVYIAMTLIREQARENENDEQCVDWHRTSMHKSKYDAK